MIIINGNPIIDKALIHKKFGYLILLDKTLEVKWTIFIKIRTIAQIMTSFKLFFILHLRFLAA